MIRRLLHRIGLLHSGCEHAFVNTGDSYTDPVYNVTIVIKQCADCGLVVIAGV